MTGTYNEFTTVGALGEAYTHVTDSQAVREELVNCGLKGKALRSALAEYPSVLVLTGDAEVLAVYGTTYNFPTDSDRAYLLWESVNGIGQINYDNI